MRTCQTGDEENIMTTHGHSRRGKMTPTYKSWNSMRYRVKAMSKAKHYGHIKICSRWLTFSNFLHDMGERPSGCSLDRIDNNGNYEPDNCRWSTPKEQANNRRTNRVLALDGVSHTLAEWAKKTGLKQSTISMRLHRYGWSVKKALTTLVRGKR